MLRPPNRCKCGCALRQSPNLLFILATGRSGSTSLLWFLNSLAGVHLSGENAGIANLLVDIADAATTTKRRAHLAAWSNTLDDARVQCAGVRLLLNVVDPPPTAKVVGFKTIRLVENAERFATLFPCARFLVNVRDESNLRTQSKSSFYRLRSRQAEARLLRNHTHALRAFAAREPARRRVVRTEDLTIRRLQELLHWLAPLEAEAHAPIGAPRSHRFDAARHSPCPTYYDRANRRAIPPNDPCAACDRRAAVATGSDGGGNALSSNTARAYGGCTVLRAPRIDGVATLNDLAKWAPRDARHEGIVACNRTTA